MVSYYHGLNGENTLKIPITRNGNGDSRTVDVTKVARHDVYYANVCHIEDMRRALGFFSACLNIRGSLHDKDKVGTIDFDDFYRNFKSSFEQNDWLVKHKKLNRHHLNDEDGIPDDVNLLDVIEFVADIVTACLARKGAAPEKQKIDEETGDTVFLSSRTLQKALNNTIDLLLSRCFIPNI